MSLKQNYNYLFLQNYPYSTWVWRHSDVLQIMKGGKGPDREGLCGRVCSINIQEKKWALIVGDGADIVAQGRIRKKHLGVWRTSEKVSTGRARIRTSQCMDVLDKFQLSSRKNPYFNISLLLLGASQNSRILWAFWGHFSTKYTYALNDISLAVADWYFRWRLRRLSTSKHHVFPESVCIKGH